MRKNIKILIIEDDVSLRKNTAEILELLGYDVISSTNGISGVAEAKAHIPDIVICDIMMPEMDGYGVLRELSIDDATKHIPFVFLSAKTERSDIQKGIELGADDYLTKPFEEHELISAIVNSISKAALLARASSTGPTNKFPFQKQISSLQELKNFFKEHGKMDRFAKDEKIYKDGDQAKGVYLILKGVVKNHKIGSRGKELTNSFFQEYDFLGFTSFSENIPFQEFATAEEEVELMFVSTHDLREILDTNQSLLIELVNLGMI